jgi:hypothetical protein
MNARILVLASLIGLSLAERTNAAGFTEPPITFYGKVTSTSGGYAVPITSGTLSWTLQPTNGGAPLVVTAPLSALSGGYSYRLQIPVEKVPAGFTLSAASIAATGTSTSYSRSFVTHPLSGTAATIVSPAMPAGGTFTFAENQRGKVERVDFELKTAFRDSDGDGIPDWWEILYGFDPFDPTDASLDTDGDGKTNRDEYLAGTNPKDPAGPTPTTTPSQLLNLSTRNEVGTGDNVVIVGFIVVGTDNKKVILRGVGPSLQLPNRLRDPVLELHANDGTVLASNNNWRDKQQMEISATGIPPSNDLEAALVTTLQSKSAAQGGAGYTGIVGGADGTSGIGVVEIYDLDTAANAKLANISTRGFVGTADNLLIGGFIPGPPNRTPIRVLIRALGPSLTAFGVSGALQDPVLELHDANGTLLVNDNWQDASEASEIQATLPPGDNRESAILTTLPPGNSGYTALVRGANGTTGVALLEIYALN